MTPSFSGCERGGGECRGRDDGATLAERGCFGCSRSRFAWVMQVPCKGAPVIGHSASGSQGSDVPAGPVDAELDEEGATNAGSGRRPLRPEAVPVERAACDGT